MNYQDIIQEEYETPSSTLEGIISKEYETPSSTLEGIIQEEYQKQRLTSTDLLENIKNYPSYEKQELENQAIQKQRLTTTDLLENLKNYPEKYPAIEEPYSLGQANIDALKATAQRLFWLPQEIGETAGTFMTGASAYMPAKIAGSIVGAFNPEKGKEVEHRISELMTLQPRNEYARLNNEAIGEVFNFILKPAQIGGEIVKRGYLKQAPFDPSSNTKNLAEWLAYITEFGLELAEFKAMHKLLPKGKAEIIKEKIRKGEPPPISVLEKVRELPKEDLNIGRELPKSEGIKSEGIKSEGPKIEIKETIKPQKEGFPLADEIKEKEFEAKQGGLIETIKEKFKPEPLKEGEEYYERLFTNEPKESLSKRIETIQEKLKTERDPLEIYRLQKEKRIAESVYKEKTKKPEYYADIEGKEFEIAKEREKYVSEPKIALTEEDLPEIVEFAKELSGGKYPVIMDRIKEMKGLAAGLFRTTKERIELIPEIFKEPKQAVKVLLHEIGHVADWVSSSTDMPNTLKRGNIFGRIASLYNYTKKLLEEYPWAKDKILSDSDRARIRSEVERVAKLEKERTIEVKEPIIKEMPLRAEEITKIWNDVLSREKDPSLYDYIARLSKAEKLSIMKEALKGKVADWVTFKRAIVEGYETVKKTIKLTPEELQRDIRQRYYDMIREEIKNRALYEHWIIKEELKKLTETYKPFDIANAPDWYKKYRYSSPELYADSFSAFMNNPEMVKQIAPTFYKAFLNYIEKKPKVKMLYDEIVKRKGKGSEEISKHRREQRHEMYRKHEEALRKQIEDKKRSFRQRIKKAYSELKRDISDRFQPIYDSIQNKDVKEHVQYRIEEYIYRESEGQFYLNEVAEKSTKHLKKLNISEYDIADYVFLQRVINERKGIPNPKFYTPSIALKELEYLKKIIGDEKYSAIERTWNEFIKIRKDYIIARLKEANLYNQELMNYIEANEYYATFDVTKYLDNKYGRDISAKIYEQIGTLQEIGNPFISTIMKDLSLLKAVNRKMAVSEVIKSLPDAFKEAEYYKILIPKDKEGKGGIGKLPKLPKDPDLDLIMITEGGELKGYYGPKEMIQGFKENPVKAWFITRILQAFSNPFREIYTRKRVGFAAFNLFKDMFSFLKILPSGYIPYRNLMRYIPQAIKGLPEAWRGAIKKYDPHIQELKQGKSLIASITNEGKELSDLQYEAILIKLGFRNEGKSPLSNAIQRLKMGTSTTLNFASEFSELTTKIGADNYLKKYHPELSSEERMHIIRRAGSPPFLVQGEATPLTNNILLYSNPHVQGWKVQKHAFQKNPAGYMYNWVQYTLIPKLIMYMGAMGLISKGVEQIYANTSEYDKSNYYIIPLAMTKNNKAAILRIPVDEISRLTGGLIWKGLKNVRSLDELASLFDYTAGQFPSLNPAIGILWDTIDYLSGNNPYDHFRGKYAIPQEIFEAHDIRTLKRFFQYISNKAGLGIIYQFDTDDIDTIKSDLEKKLNMPIIGDVIGRFIKVTDIGMREIGMKAGEPARIDEARNLLDTKEAINKIYNNQKLEFKDIDAINKRLILHPKSFENLLPSIGIRKWGDAQLTTLLRAKTDTERVAILSKYIELEKRYKK